MYSVLAKVYILKDLKDNQQALDLVIACMQEKEFAAGHCLIKQGDKGDEFFVLMEGSVSVYKNTPDGDSYKVTILKAESHPAFGEGGLIEGETRSASVFCETKVKCLVLTRAKFNEFSVSHPELALPIVKKISQTIIERLNQTSNDLMLMHKALMNEIRSN